MATPSALELTPERLWVWGIRSGLSVVDQGFTSGSGFLINLLLARWLSADVYGAFAVAFAGFLFVAGFHNVLLLEPMSVMGPAGYAKRLPAYFASQLRVHIVLVGPLSILLLLAGAVVALRTPHSPLVGALIGSGVALPLLLLHWLARRMCYIVQRPSVAAITSSFYLAFILGGLCGLRSWGALSPLTAFLLVAMASAITSLLLLREIGVLKTSVAGEGTPAWREVLRENYTYGRWLVGSTVLFSVSTQTQTFLVAAFLGLGAAGILRAMQIPSLLMTQVTTAAGLLVLPAFSYDFGRGRTERLRHRAMLSSLGLGVAALCFAAVLALLAGRAEHLLFGGKYAAYVWLMPVLALIPVCTGFSIGYSMALRASQKPHYDLLCNAVAAPVGLVSAILFMRWWGLAGAAFSMVLGFATSAAVVFLSYRRAAREHIRVLTPEYGTKSFIAAIDFVSSPLNEISSPTKAVSTSSEPAPKADTQSRQCK